MTNEEAIFCEKSYIGETNCVDCKYYGTDTCKSRESHKMAIKALEQQSSEDCISREAVETAFHDLGLGDEENGAAEYMCGLWDAYEAIKSLPLVTSKAESEEKQEHTKDEKMIDAIDFAIKATDSQDDYSMGMRNGMRYVKSLIDGKEPQYELRRTDEEIKLGIDLGDEVVGDYGAKGVVVGMDTYKGKVMLSLLMRNHKVPQLVTASRYKTKTGRRFSQIIEVLDQIKGEADGK